jgi:hypothetical protein
VLRAAAEDMLGGAAKHTALEADEKRALEVSDGVDRKSGRSIDRARLIFLHCLFSWGHESTDWRRSRVRVRRVRQSGSIRGDRDRSGKGGSGTVFEFPKDSLGNEAFLSAEDGMVSDGGDTKRAKSIELGGASREGGQIRRAVEWIGVESLL